MDKNDIRYQAYLTILEKELIPAMGCTEPIALAYAAAKARDVLRAMPARIHVQASGSIIKNVKSVVVPNTGGLKGMAAAAAAGVIAGHTEKELEVIAQVDEAMKQEIHDYMDSTPISVDYLDDGHEFDLIVTVYDDSPEDSGRSAQVRITDQHTNIIQIKENDQVVYDKPLSDIEDSDSLYQLLNIKGIWDFIKSVDPEDIRPVLERQIDYNMAIAEEGLRGEYGASIGKVLLSSFGDAVENRAKAMAAAGSDARMNGCELPVIINSGSGNQGITCCVPVVVYARELGCPEDKLLRALALSNLTAIYAKTGIGTLSAYCGAVSAGSGAGAGIAYLHHENYEDVIHTIVNSLAIVSGIVCDGAKASCAAKIASSVDAAILGYHMYQHGQEFKGGDGIVMKGIEPTIKSIGRLGKEGMRETNKEIIKMMLGE